MGVLDKLKGFFVGKEEAVSTSVQENSHIGIDNNGSDLEIDEEDKLVVALAASIMAGKDKNNSYYHITKIRRIK